MGIRSFIKAMFGNKSKKNKSNTSFRETASQTVDYADEISHMSSYPSYSSPDYGSYDSGSSYGSDSGSSCDSGGGSDGGGGCD